MLESAARSRGDARAERLRGVFGFSRRALFVGNAPALRRASSSSSSSSSSSGKGNAAGDAVRSNAPRTASLVCVPFAFLFFGLPEEAPAVASAAAIASSSASSRVRSDAPTANAWSSTSSFTARTASAAPISTHVSTSCASRRTSRGVTYTRARARAAACGTAGEARTAPRSAGPWGPRRARGTASSPRRASARIRPQGAPPGARCARTRTIGSANAPERVEAQVPAARPDVIVD